MIFTARELDAETGLYYYRARYYDWSRGAFTQEDPIGFKGGDTNLYAYAQGNSINMVDPYGETSFFTWIYWNVQGPILVTDIEDKSTTFYPSLFNSGETFSIETRNDVAKKSEPGAKDPFTTPNISLVNIKSLSYGPEGAYIDTGDSRGRDIHGGGIDLIDSYAPIQGWLPTYGCTRGQNSDLQKLSSKITEFQKRYHKIPIRYIRK